MVSRPVVVRARPTLSGQPAVHIDAGLPPSVLPLPPIAIVNEHDADVAPIGRPLPELDGVRTTRHSVRS